MGYKDYDYAFLYKDYRGENGPNWQRDMKKQVNSVEKMLREQIIVFDETDNLYIWQGSKKPIYPELIPLVHIASMRIIPSDYFKDNSLVSKHYSQSFQVSLRHKEDFQTSFIRDLLNTNIFWRREAAKRVLERVEDYLTGKLYLEDGVAKWTSNNNVIPIDCYEPLVYSNILPRVYLDKNNDARKSESNKMISAYRKKQKGYKPSAMERAEMENAFGKGTPIADVLTGKRIL